MNFGERYTIFNAVGLIGIKKRLDLEWGIEMILPAQVYKILART
jgi:hypothetical protein